MGHGAPPRLTPLSVGLVIIGIYQLILKDKLYWLKFRNISQFDIQYARLRRNCSSLKYDLFRCNIIKDSRFVCGFIREDASHFLLNCHLHVSISRGQFSLIFYTTIIFGEILELYYMETLKKTYLKIFCPLKQYLHSH